MKEGYVLKSPAAPDADSLKKINRYTRRDFTAQEIYTFPVVLCDNEIDRDGERFTVTALRELSKLFLGKTGIFNHSMQAQNQTARIYDCRVEQDETRRTTAEEPYTRLVAQAYLPKTDKNEDFITELDSGIKKEVSVGCAVQKITCSICGADLRNGSCEHVRGRTYDSKVCCAVLDEPTDAYEWSFVAVPAQREAGVIKSYAGNSVPPAEQDVLKSLRETDGGLTLTREQCTALKQSFAVLEQDAAFGRAYRDTLKKDFLRYAALAQPELPADALRRTADAMSVQDLKSWGKSFQKQAAKKIPLTPQLAGAQTDQPETGDGYEPFRI